MVTQQRNRGREYKLLQIQPKDVSAFPHLPPNCLWGNKLCCELFEFLSLCSVSQSSQSQADSLWLELSSVGTYAATAVKLKSMTFSFFSEHERQVMHELSDKSRCTETTQQRLVSQLKDQKFPKETIFNINPFLCVDSGICQISEPLKVMTYLALEPAKCIISFPFRLRLLPHTLKKKLRTAFSRIML